ncbi:hypothetical protein HNY73_003093 [Argiope bruennichi]|uniref:Uncharacterized protein n=1 Tax=Argiope bruennichi TaxID=94029 RepID=A0A8T0FZY5_ARGBR|nr:hypothetical protein HNY73_003093 [Argiope bruennichi]
MLRVDLNRAAFLYDCTIDYSSHLFVRIGQMDIVYNHCGALKFSEKRLDCAALMAKLKSVHLVKRKETDFDIVPKYHIAFGMDNEKALKYGRSKRFQEVMRIFSRNATERIDSSALLKYFNSLIKGLKKDNRDEYIGWKSIDSMSCPTRKVLLDPDAYYKFRQKTMKVDKENGGN